MKTRDNSSVLFLHNGTAICEYCGKVLETLHKCEWDEYDKDEYDLYECTCDDWNQAIEMDNELRKLNQDLGERFCEYQEKFNRLSNKKYCSNVHCWYKLV